MYLRVYMPNARFYHNNTACCKYGKQDTLSRLDIVFGHVVQAGETVIMSGDDEEEDPRRLSRLADRRSSLKPSPISSASSTPTSPLRHRSSSVCPSALNVRSSPRRVLDIPVHKVRLPMLCLQVSNYAQGVGRQASHLGFVQATRDVAGLGSVH